jgi:hypothetical protein
VSRRWVVVAGCVALLLLGAAWLRHLAQAPQGTDTQQIMAQIQRAQTAAEERNVGALMSVVSPDFKDENGITRPVLTYEARDQLRDAQRVEVAIPFNDLHIQVAPSGREASSTCRVEVRITDRPGGSHVMNFTPTLQWRKERVRRYLFFPAEEWCVLRAQGIGAGEGE